MMATVGRELLCADSNQDCTTEERTTFSSGRTSTTGSFVCVRSNAQMG